MFNVGNESLRRNICIKYLSTINIKYNQSRNGLILEYRNYRNKMAALDDALYKLSLSCELDYQKLEPSQSAIINDMSKMFASSTKEDRFKTYINGINLLENFINGQSIKDDKPFSKNELKAARMMAGHLFFVASQNIAELNLR